MNLFEELNKLNEGVEVSDLSAVEKQKLDLFIKDTIKEELDKASEDLKSIIDHVVDKVSASFDLEPNDANSQYVLGKLQHLNRLVESIVNEIKNDKIDESVKITEVKGEANDVQDKELDTKLNDESRLDEGIHHNGNGKKKIEEETQEEKTFIVHLKDGTEVERIQAKDDTEAWDKLNSKHPGMSPDNYYIEPEEQVKEEIDPRKDPVEELLSPYRGVEISYFSTLDHDSDYYYVYLGEHPNTDGYETDSLEQAKAIIDLYLDKGAAEADKYWEEHVGKFDESINKLEEGPVKSWVAKKVSQFVTKQQAIKTVDEFTAALESEFGDTYNIKQTKDGIVISPKSGILCKVNVKPTKEGAILSGIETADGGKVDVGTLEDANKLVASMVDIANPKLATEGLKEEFIDVNKESLVDLDRDLDAAGFNIVSKKDYKSYGDKLAVHYQIITKEGNKGESDAELYANKLSTLLDEFEDKTGQWATYNLGLQTDGFISAGFDIRPSYYEPGEDVASSKPTMIRLKDGEPYDDESKAVIKDIADHMGMSDEEVKAAIPSDSKKNESNENLNTYVVYGHDYVDLRADGPFDNFDAAKKFNDAQDQNYSICEIVGAKTKEDAIKVIGRKHKHMTLSDIKREEMKPAQLPDEDSIENDIPDVDAPEQELKKAKLDLDEGAREDRKTLGYLWRKQKECPLDRDEMIKLHELIQKYGRPDEQFEEATEDKYYVFDIYGGYNKQEKLASDIEVWASNIKQAEEEAIHEFKQGYNYIDDGFGLEAVITYDGGKKKVEEALGPNKLFVDLYSTGNGDWDKYYNEHDTIYVILKDAKIYCKGKRNELLDKYNMFRGTFLQTYPQRTAEDVEAKAQQMIKEVGAREVTPEEFIKIEEEGQKERTAAAFSHFETRKANEALLNSDNLYSKEIESIEHDIKIITNCDTLEDIEKHEHDFQAIGMGFFSNVSSENFPLKKREIIKTLYNLIDKEEAELTQNKEASKEAEELKSKMFAYAESHYKDAKRIGNNKISFISGKESTNELVQELSKEFNLKPEYFGFDSSMTTHNAITQDGKVVVKIGIDHDDKNREEIVFEDYITESDEGDKRFEFNVWYYENDDEMLHPGQPDRDPDDVKVIMAKDLKSAEFVLNNDPSINCYELKERLNEGLAQKAINILKKNKLDSPYITVSTRNDDVLHFNRAEIWKKYSFEAYDELLSKARKILLDNGIKLGTSKGPGVYRLSTNISSHKRGSSYASLFAKTVKDRLGISYDDRYDNPNNTKLVYLSFFGTHPSGRSVQQMYKEFEKIATEINDKYGKDIVGVMGGSRGSGVIEVWIDKGYVDESLNETVMFLPDDVKHAIREYVAQRGDAVLKARNVTDLDKATDDEITNLFWDIRNILKKEGYKEGPFVALFNLDEPVGFNEK